MSDDIFKKLPKFGKLNFGTAKVNFVFKNSKTYIGPLTA